MKAQKIFKELTARESKIMQILWDKEEAFVHNIVDAMPNPKPAYNTVSTFIRILEQKGYVGHEVYGRSYAYFPVVSKEKYTRLMMKNVLKGYFDNSLSNLVTFFANDEAIPDKDLLEMQIIVDKAMRGEKVKTAKSATKKANRK